MDFVSFIIGLGIAQGVFLAAVLLTSIRGNTRANRILGLLILLFTVDMACVLLDYQQWYAKMPHLLMINHPQQFLYGPILLWYVMRLTRPESPFKPKYYLNLLPFVLTILYFASTFYFKSATFKIEYYEMWHQTVRFADFFWSLAHVAFNLCYFIVSIGLLRQHKFNIRQNYSYQEKITLSWLHHLLLMLMAVFIMNTIFDVLYLMQKPVPAAGPIMAVLMAVVIYAIGYMGWRQPAIFQDNEGKTHQPKYAKSALTTRQSRHIYEHLSQLMTTEKPYLNSGLTIKNLADRLNIPAYRLSQVINEQAGQNFFDFVNQFRIREVQNRLRDSYYDAYSILSIAYDSGFNSKSSFNTAFRKQVGTTPSRFRQQ
ncbi:MAG: helix-turn-helix domain-containing protein [Caldithrix sp.]|nr:helix-turn-helix domain-containing protein [Caldithrix sp.]